MDAKIFGYAFWCIFLSLIDFSQALIWFYWLNFLCRLFMHRYRDIDPNIRVSCIQSLGFWILSYPSHFLQDRYLKYLGWTLNDKVQGFIVFIFLYGWLRDKIKSNAFFVFYLNVLLDFLFSSSIFCFLLYLWL